MKRFTDRLEVRRLLLPLAGAAIAVAVLGSLAKLLPIEFSAAHTGRLAEDRRGLADRLWAETNSPSGVATGDSSDADVAPAWYGTGSHTGDEFFGGDAVELAEFAASDEPPVGNAPALDSPAEPPVSHVHDTRVPGRSAIDLDGRLHRIGESPECRAVVLVFLAPDCPISNGSIPELNRLAGSFGGRGVEWFGVVADRAVSRRRAVEHYRAYEPAFPLLFDASGELLEVLGPTHVPQCFVLDAAGRVRYSGRIDDRQASLGRQRPLVERRFLADALEDVLAGRSVAAERTEPIGCLIEVQTAGTSGDVTWCREIAPIVFAHCVACHRPGEVGPFPLTRYEEASRRARQIALVASERIMPPWQPQAGFGHFRGERRLSEQQIALLAEWAEAGAAYGDPSELPPLPEFAPGWRLGTPDLVLELPAGFEVPPDGNDIYQYFVLPTGLRDDRAITAIEFRPTSPEVVHHASFCYDTSGAGRRLDEADPGPGYRRFGGAGFTPDGSLGGWAPGVTPQHLPDGLGRFIARGADLVVQVHYHPIGRRIRDRSRIGIHFARGPVRQHLAELMVANMNLRIPAGAERFVHRASYTLPVAVTVHAVAPHMHLLGREITATAELPDGREARLARIADWDFNWQDVYFYARPLRLPAGTRIDVECVYDNSASNPFNPSSPPRDVKWGERSIDEMGICYFDVTADSPSELERLIGDNQAAITRQLRDHPWLLEPPEEFGADPP
ncbi:MAG TPA: redoxin domain-containing protein [Planctomycetaceae bacterium]|nr:redoxin domain-containing protein [Planctomycetaceae bacterium]